MNTAPATTAANSSKSHHGRVPESKHQVAAQLSAPCRPHKTRHLPQGCQISEQRDGGFTGTAMERHHHPQPSHHLLHSIC
jgi:hypothetical protein